MEAHTGEKSLKRDKSHLRLKRLSCKLVLVVYKVTSDPSIKLTSNHLPTFLKKGTVRVKHLNINRFHQVQRLNAHNWHRQLFTLIDLIHILVIGLELVCNGGSRLRKIIIKR